MGKEMKEREMVLDIHRQQNNTGIFFQENHTLRNQNEVWFNTIKFYLVTYFHDFTFKSSQILSSFKIILFN